MPTVPIEEVPLDAVLTDAESEELMNFLESGQLPQDSMTFAVLDGFLTAIVVGPEEVPPSTWFPMIWGTPGDRPIFRSPDEEKRIRKLVMRAYNAILLCFSLEDGEFVPAFDEYLREEGKPYVSAEAWCSGFYLGIDLAREAWDPLFADEAHDGLLDPILWYVEEELSEELSWERVLEAVREELLRLIVPSVKAINNYWKARQREADRRGELDMQGRLRSSQGPVPPKGKRRSLDRWYREPNPARLARR
jgi:uncharacterized protein